MRLIVADSSPLIAFAGIGRLDILCSVAELIVVPKIVALECTQDTAKPGASGIIAALDADQLLIHQGQDARLPSEVPNLDAGEAAAIALAKALAAPVLMDEKLGRVVAKLHNVPVIGSAGVLLAAKQQGVIAAVSPILQAWQATGYFLADALLTEVLLRAGETRRLD